MEGARIQNTLGGLLLALILLISIVLGTIPLAGIVWIFFRGAVTTVDGLFMSLILLCLSGIFYLNAAMELRDRGVFPFAKKTKANPPEQQLPKTN
jgi:hypothetical protein